MSNDKKNRIFGIDLGTTYSCIAYVNDVGKTEVVPNSDGDLTTPSVVYFEDSQNVVVGKTAKDELKTSPERVISLVKRSMGEPDVRFSGVTDSPLSPQEVSAHILRKLVKDAQDYTRQEQPIKDVVITCPAYFGFSQKEATRQAGEIAGLNVRYVIPEPTAAAIFYGMTEDTSRNQTVLVYDLGGGTFDVTVIEVNAGDIEVVCVDGDHNLGGANWDDDVATWFAEKFSEEHGTKTGGADGLRRDVAGTARPRRNGQEVADFEDEACDESDLRHGSCANRNDRGRVRHDYQRSPREHDHADEERHRESKSEGSGQRQQDPAGRRLDLHAPDPGAPEEGVSFHRGYQSAGSQPSGGQGGGGVRIQVLPRRRGHEKSGRAEQTGEDITGVTADAVPEPVRQRAEASVALDQGMQLTQMQSLTRKTIQNVTSKSFGVVAVDAAGKEHVANLIVVDEKVPADVTEKFSTVHEGQTSVSVRCMENTVRERGYVDLEASTEIGKAELRFARSVPKGAPLKFRFSLSDDGLLSVHATDLTTGGEVDISIQTAAILTADEVEEKKVQSTAITVS